MSRDRTDTVRTTRDDLTVAYLTMGALQAIAIKGGCLPQHVADRYGGELGFIASVVSHALELDKAADKVQLIGVFCYDIAEPCGHAIALSLIDDDPLDVTELIKKLIDENAMEEA